MDVRRGDTDLEIPVTEVVLLLIRQGIDDGASRQIIKHVKGLKLKVQISAQGDELRVNGKKRDDLQEAIQAVKEMTLDLPVQFVNFRD